MGGARSTTGDGVGGSTRDGAGKVDPEAEAQRLEQTVDALRDNLDSLVSELDHRRHQLMRRLRRYGTPIAIAVAAIGVGVVGRRVWRRMRMRRR
jgi:dihydropteroate synthase